MLRQNMFDLTVEYKSMNTDCSEILKLLTASLKNTKVTY